MRGPLGGKGKRFGYSSRSHLVGVATALLCVVAPSAASASWGSHCTNHLPHCYALAEWYMASEGEKVVGLEGNFDTTSMNVTDWSEAGESFVDNEQWLSFPN